MNPCDTCPPVDDDNNNNKNDNNNKTVNNICNDHGNLILNEIDYTIRVGGLTILAVIILMSITINNIVVSYGSVS